MNQRVALVTGASSGIGQALALALAPRWRLALVARRTDRLATLAARITASGGEALAIALDLASDGAAGLAVTAAIERFGRIDALINNAGVFLTGRLGAMGAAQLESLWRLNLRAPMLLAEAALPHLTQARGTIVNVSSAAAEGAFPGCGAYAATKAGLEAWSRVLREELREHGIRVAVLVPGMTDTEGWTIPPPIPRERMSTAADVAEAIRFALEAPPSVTIERMVLGLR